MTEGEDMEDGGMDKFKVIILCISQDSPEKLFHFCSATKLCPNLCNPMDCQVLSMGFSRQEYWSGLPFPPPGDLPNPGIEPMTLVSPALAGGSFTTVLPRKP